jgi:Flp pilus assembly protein TadD
MVYRAFGCILAPNGSQSCRPTFPPSGQTGAAAPHPKQAIEVSAESIMMNRILRATPVLICAMSFAALSAQAQTLRITLPKQSFATPVQELNQEGVKAVNQHHLKKAEHLFYKAYLLDPDNPFTLSNLGYISEIHGNVQAALRFYKLAAAERTDTTIAQSSIPALKGKPLMAITESFENRDLRVNYGNIEAMALLQEGRAAEAEDLLRKTLKLDSRNAFTLNNLGYTMESEGDLASAYKYYTDAADQHSTATIVVAPDANWRGKPISEIAESNARAVSDRIANENSRAAQVARLNLQGVSALNHNEIKKAQQLFQKAYQLDPHNAFALNNMGYVSELQGDEETASDFYQQAQQSPGAALDATITSRKELEGRPLEAVAESNTHTAQANLATEQAAKRRESGPIVLMRRNNTPVTAPSAPKSQSPSPAPPNQPQHQ